MVLLQTLVVCDVRQHDAGRKKNLLHYGYDMLTVSLLAKRKILFETKTKF